MRYDVFISYSTKDLSLVERFRKQLEMQDVRVFVAEYDAQPGQLLTRTIKAAIKRCDLFILLWSKNSSESDFVRDEVALADSLEKEIIPIQLEKDIQLPVFIRDLKYLPAYEGMEFALQWIKKNVKERCIKYQRNFAITMVVLLVLIIVGLVCSRK